MGRNLIGLLNTGYNGKGDDEGCSKDAVLGPCVPVRFAVKVHLAQHYDPPSRPIAGLRASCFQLFSMQDDGYKGQACTELFNNTRLWTPAHLHPPDMITPLAEAAVYPTVIVAFVTSSGPSSVSPFRSRR